MNKIIVYGMNTCPDCIAIKKQIENREDEFEYIEISEHVHQLKAFICLRDNDPIFDEVKKEGKLGIPCFIKLNHEVTLNPEDVGLINEGKICSLEDHTNGKKGC